MRFLDLGPLALVLLATHLGSPAQAGLCSADAVPAATLAHVTLWTDFASPTLNFGRPLLPGCGAGERLVP